MGFEDWTSAIAYSKDLAQLLFTLPARPGKEWVWPHGQFPVGGAENRNERIPRPSFAPPQNRTRHKPGAKRRHLPYSLSSYK